jgi:prephenate dehydratase
MNTTLKKIGFLGPSGTNSEEAARKYTTIMPGELIPYETIFDVIAAADAQEIDHGVVPIENSSEGSVTVTLDFLASKDVSLKICQEIDIPIVWSLLVNGALGLADITDVLSHPQGLAQCQHYIRKNLGNVTTHTTNSTAAAAEDVAAGKYPRGAAIAPSGPLAAKLGLTVLADKINDLDSVTRFVVLAKKDHVPTGKDKTSLVFSAKKDKPGVLFELLGEFAKRSINLTKIESRPRKKMLGDYIFFIDLEGHRKDEKVGEALKMMGQKASFFKLLGSYPEAG